MHTMQDVRGRICWLPPLLFATSCTSTVLRGGIGAISPTYTLVNAVTVNSNIHKARFDFALRTQSSGNVMGQAKSSLADPAASALVAQISRCRILLWFYPGRDEDNSNAPTNYRTGKVKEKIAMKQLVFLSGAGCVSPLALDFVILMKNLAAAVHNIRSMLLI